MSRDPYDDVKREVESALSHARSLHSSYGRLSSTASSLGTSRDVVSEARRELDDALEGLQADVNDLEFSVRAVEESGERWGVGSVEVNARRNHLEGVKREIQTIRSSLRDGSAESQSGNKRGHRPSERADGDTGYALDDIDLESGRSRTKEKQRSTGNDRYDDDPNATERDREDLREWEMQEQQMLMWRQDNTIDVISKSLSTLAQQAGLIGQEVGEQTEMLDDLSYRVDATDNRLTAANKRIREFIRRNEETKSGWCIVILIIVLCILLLLVIIT